MPYRLAGREFARKSDITCMVRAIAKEATLGRSLGGQRFAFMCELFANHPRADLKIGPGIAEIHVRQALRNPSNREFWIRQAGSDTWTDISWTECVTATSPRSEFSGAARLALKPITQEFCDSVFAARAVNGTLKCPLTGQHFARSEAHIDHNDPWPFRRIVDEFIDRERIDLRTVKYDGFEHGSTFVTFRDTGLADRFIAFHQSVAKLRVVSVDGNLRRERT